MGVHGCAYAVPAFALLAFAGRISTAKSDVVGCKPPGTNILSRVFFSEPSGESGQAASDLKRPGTRAEYQCDPGYVVVGDRTRTCLENGQWDGTAPHCYLNVAGRSSLNSSREYRALVDGNRTTAFAVLDERLPLQIDLYSTFPLLEIRIVADYNMTARGDTIQLDQRPESAVNMRVGSPQMVQGNLYEHITILSPVNPRDTRMVTVTQGKAVTTSGPAIPHLREIEIVANSTGLSWRQCLDDVGNSDIVSTWAMGDRCYHVVKNLATRDDAEQTCLRLGFEGTLVRIVSGGLMDKINDMLRYPGNLLDTYWVSEEVLGAVAASDESEQQVGPAGIRTRVDSSLFENQDEAVLSGPAPSRPPCVVLRSSINGNTQEESCMSKHGFICQRAPRLCGSPAQEPSLTYITPGPKLEGETINVTCSDPSLTGYIECGSHQWTQPTFCQSPVGPSFTNETEAVLESPVEATGHLGAIIGGLIGVAAVLAFVCAAVLLRRRKRRQAAKPSKEQYGILEFWSLSQNPVYGSCSDDHVYSEIGVEEAVYAEPMLVAGCQAPLASHQPPRLPPPRQGSSSTGSHSPTPAPPVHAAVAVHRDSDGEVLPDQTETLTDSGSIAKQTGVYWQASPDYDDIGAYKPENLTALGTRETPLDVESPKFSDQPLDGSVPSPAGACTVGLAGSPDGEGEYRAPFDAIQSGGSCE